MNFVDEAVIRVRGGRGGSGCVAFRREKYVPRGGPSGGDGGAGGSVWLVGDEGLNTLYHLQGHGLYAAERGRHGEGSNRTGRSGDDFEVRVPLGTQAYEAAGGVLLGELIATGERLCVAHGGRGGRGNARFATATNRAPRRSDPGEEGEERAVLLELKLLADVGVIGLPNAGKSTLISRMSAARPKIADYPFTTLVPQLGVVGPRPGEPGYGDPASEPFVIADLPGLIAGAAEGAGLGHRFLRHVERCRVLAHLVDLAAFEDDAAADLATVEHELGAFDPALLERPRVVVGSKLDAVRTERREGVERAAAERGLTYLEISATTGEGLEALRHELAARLAAARAAERAAGAAAGAASAGGGRGGPGGSGGRAMRRRERIGLFGGSFDPIHAGHVAPVQDARREAGLDRVIYLPTARPPHKPSRGFAPAWRRFAMVELALLAEEGLYASARELTPEREVFTIDTVEAIAAEEPDAELHLVIGSDSLAELDTWRRWRELIERVRLVALVRPGFEPGAIAPGLPPELRSKVERGEIRFIAERPLRWSATELRETFERGGEPPGGALHPQVLDYIRKYALYR